MITPDTVSILIPVYNRESLVCETLASCLAQTYRDFLLVIFDDGSTDDTVSVIDTFLKKNLPADMKNRVTFTGSSENRGQGYARIELAKNMLSTDLACWQDSDDIMRPDRLEKQVALLRSGGYDAVYSYMMFFAGTNPYATRTMRTIDVKKWNRDLRSIHNNTNTATALFTRDVANLVPDVAINHGGWDTVWSYAQAVHGMRLGCVEEPLYYCRRHPGRVVNRRKSPEWVEAYNLEKPVVANELRKLQDMAKRP